MESYGTGGKVVAVGALFGLFFYRLYLGCAHKSVELGLGWPKLRMCNANYAAEEPVDAKIRSRKKVRRTFGTVA